MDKGEDGVEKMDGVGGVAREAALEVIHGGFDEEMLCDNVSNVCFCTGVGVASERVSFGWTVN